jgi:hypothetical protein
MQDYDGLAGTLGLTLRDKQPRQAVLSVGEVALDREPSSAIASVCAEHQRPDARRNIEVGLGLHAQGLQDKATARAADQGVGANAITHRRGCP